MRALTRNTLRTILSFGLCIGLGLSLGRLGGHFWPSLKQLIIPKQLVYFTSNEKLKSNKDNAQIRVLSWTSLLPQKERDIIARYQIQPSEKTEDMTSQILRSIEAATDPDYRETLISTNTVNSLDNQMVSISSFIVPIDFYENKSVKNMFLVPYFGACIHFPPPPPNQMIFVKLESGFMDVDVTKAYTLTGRINLGLFEDPLGTSAYTLDVVSITPFYGQPDDFRKH